MITLITSLLAITISAGTSLLYATIGEIYTERSGILNLGIEGMMLMGAVCSFAVSYYTNSLILAIQGVRGYIVNTLNIGHQSLTPLYIFY